MFQRTLAPVIREISSQFPVLLLTGPRQVGKTTLLEMLTKPNRRYVTLDDLNLRGLARQDPDLFIQTFKPPVTIDEIQYAPELFSSIKKEVDRRRQKPGMYWLTGSQKFAMMKGVTESLAGRVALIDLLGLSQAEIEGRPKTPPFLPDTKWRAKAKRQSEQPKDMRAVYHRPIIREEAKSAGKIMELLKGKMKKCGLSLQEQEIAVQIPAAKGWRERAFAFTLLSAGIRVILCLRDSFRGGDTFPRRKGSCRGEAVFLLRG